MRVENWELKLSDYLLDVAGVPFSYGVCDCVVFASDAVNIICNIDPMHEGRGRYDNLKDGAALIKDLRGSYAGIMDFHFERLSVLRRARKGDIGLKMIKGAPAYGVVWQGSRVLFKGKNGLIDHHVSDCLIAWRVD